jgi:hypothetical protein
MATIAEILNFAGNIQTAVVTHLRNFDLDAIAESTVEFRVPGVGVRWDGGEVPRRYYRMINGVLVEDHRPGELTLDIRTRRTDDDHQAYVAAVLTAMQDTAAALPALLPLYAIVESRQIGTPVTVTEEQETNTVVTWQFDVFVLPASFPTT